MTNDSEKRIIDETVPSALAGQRVDRVISLVADIPRAAASQIIDAGAVLLDGVVVKAGKIKVTEGQRIVVDLSLLPEKQLPAAEPNIKVDVVYVDDDVIVINKQAGIVVHPGAGNPTGTLVNAVLAIYPEIASVGDPFRPGVVHRLDAGTTGLMVMARTKGAYDSLVEALQRRVVVRRYLAIVWGEMSAPSGVIDAPLGRDQRDPTKMAVLAGGKIARTNYEVRQAFTLPVSCSLLECGLETGRTHQIRVHLATLGHSVVGDVVYGGARSVLSSPRPMLHAMTLKFDHPVTGIEMEFHSEIPQDFAAILEKCS
ncbi:MAG: RluA family pseudouridine synthase [Actinobacteria bacterium]|nr:RluA family pseudouridine synthase [Ilumatobacteraceae bacterium]MCX6531659.1 RluA family pseudouridine synthase [Actinomycetota bacterium]